MYVSCASSEKDSPSTLAQSHYQVLEMTSFNRTIAHLTITGSFEQLWLLIFSSGIPKLKAASLYMLDCVSMPLLIND